MHTRNQVTISCLTFAMRAIVVCLLTINISGNISITCYAQVPKYISYQGMLLDADQKPKPDGTYEFILRLYDQESAGVALWTGRQELYLREGCFATMLKQLLPGDGFDTLSFHRPYWLEIEVGVQGEPKELLPGRVRLSTAPYACFAETAGRALTLPNMSLRDLNDVDLSLPGDGYVLRWTAETGRWAAAENVGLAERESYTGGIGIDVDTVNSSISAHNTAPLWNARELLGRPINSLAPQTGQVLKWSGVDWRASDDRTESGGNAELVVSARLTGDGSAANSLDIARQNAVEEQALTWQGDAWRPGWDISVRKLDLYAGSDIKGRLGINSDAAFLELVGENGERNVTVWSDAGNPDNGRVSVHDRAGRSRAYIGLDVYEAGELLSLGQNGSVNTIMTSTAADANHGLIGVGDDSGVYKAFMRVSAGGNGEIGTRSLNGFYSALLTSFNDRGRILTADESGEYKAGMSVDLSGYGSVFTDGPNGSSNVQVGVRDVSDNSGWVGAYNDADFSVSRLTVTDDQAGAMAVYGPNGSPNIILSAESGSPNSGAIAIYDENGTAVAGINNSNGIWGRNKSFIIPDPRHSGRRIKYTCIEGPEAAIYARGKASLTNGRAVIILPEHFAAMAVDSSVTVTLTPRSAESLGLAAVAVSAAGISVAELNKGSGNYAFDYLVYAVRKGYEDYRVYLYADENGRYPELEGETSSEPRRQNDYRVELQQQEDRKTVNR